MKKVVVILPLIWSLFGPNYSLLADEGSSNSVSASAKEFRGPPALTLLPWEQFALVMLQSNEFVFVD